MSEWLGFGFCLYRDKYLVVKYLIQVLRKILQDYTKLTGVHLMGHKGDAGVNKF